jgi:membrane-associated phospholipid phosphatase
MKIAPSCSAAILALAAACPAAHGADATRRAGDVLSYALPAGVLAYELWRDDRQGAWQFGTSFLATQAATEVLKRTTHVERPDRSDDQSFPSGHASRAFAAAAFVHRRHGFDAAWPLYAAATYVGYTRVHANVHRWGDVAGSAALSVASAWWLATPRPDAKVVLVPAFAPGAAAIELHARW